MKPVQTRTPQDANGEFRLRCTSLGRGLRLALAATLAAMAAGCNSTMPSGPSDPQSNQSQLYLAPSTIIVNSLSTYAIDHTANTFTASTFGPSGETIVESGNIIPIPSNNGIVDLDPTYFPTYETSSPPLTGNWVVELPGQAALVELEQTDVDENTYTSFAPLVPTQSCPSMTAAQAFEFVTVPEMFSSANAAKIAPGSWNPTLETAYGFVTIAASGTTVQFTNVSQYNISGGTVENPVSASVTGACSQTFYGQTISVPAAVTVTNPGGTNGQSVPPSATIGIGPSGFLVEDAGDRGTGATDPATGLTYENILGAGYGAIGLLKPSTALATPSLTAAQYQGILYGAEGSANATLTANGFRLIGGFSYSASNQECTAFTSQLTASNLTPSPNTIYGGEFANNDPSANSSSECDLALDLGTQDPNNNGLYPAATVYVSESTYSLNPAGSPYAPYFGSSGSSYAFSAVAIAGQIAGKYAIFVIGMDTIGTPNQPWGIYLLQSN